MDLYFYGRKIEAAVSWRRAHQGHGVELDAHVEVGRSALTPQAPLVGGVGGGDWAVS